MPRVIRQLPYGTLTITLEPFDRSMPAKMIVLNRSQAFGDPLEVEVKNESADPDDPTFVHCKDDDEVQVLHHFAALYTLLDPRDQSPIKPIPHAVGKTMPRCPSSDAVIWCPGGGF
jgi:hypothetical protein